MWLPSHTGDGTLSVSEDKNRIPTLVPLLVQKPPDNHMKELRTEGKGVRTLRSKLSADLSQPYRTASWEINLFTGRLRSRLPLGEGGLGPLPIDLQPGPENQ